MTAASVSTENTDLRELHTLVAELQRQVAELRPSVADAVAPATPVPVRTTRRTMVRGLSAGAVGLAAALTTVGRATPAGAATGIFSGNPAVTATATTGTAVIASAGGGTDSTGVAGDTNGMWGYGVIGENGATDGLAVGVKGRSFASRWGHGVTGESTGADGVGVAGFAEGAQGVGVTGLGGKAGLAGSTGAEQGIGVQGEANVPYGIGVHGTGSMHGVQGVCDTDGGTGVVATGTTRGLFAMASKDGATAARCWVPGTGTGIDVEAGGDALVARSTGATGAGVIADSAHHQLMLRRTSAPPPPLVANGSRAAGEVVFDSAANLWLCVAGGTPGGWVRLGGGATSGALTVLASAVRAYDSRAGLPPTNVVKGRLGPGQQRDIDLKVGGGVPDGARAALLNVTVTETSAGGFLKVFKTGTAVPTASAINWDHEGTNLANAVTVATDSNESATIRCSGGSSTTHVIVDVVGYYL